MPNVQQVKLKVAVLVGDVNRIVGDVVEFPEERAKEWISAGFAEPYQVRAEPPAPAAPPAGEAPPEVVAKVKGDGKQGKSETASIAPPAESASVAPKVG